MQQQSILLLGAGRSATHLIDYIAQYSHKSNITFTIADISQETLQAKTQQYPWVKTLTIQPNNNEEQYESIVSQNTIVISLLPPQLHLQVAKICLRYEKHLLTASYLSEAMKQLHQEAKEKKLIFLNEAGLDPGIDHMSAMETLDKIRAQGGKITSFQSFCGGLIAPESDNNPWGYKFTWNPRNVVLAGQGTPAQYIYQGKYKYVPYSQLFTNPINLYFETVGDYEAYPNRDSLSYRTHYQLDDIPTMLRGTIRKKGYCKAWNNLVRLGITDDSLPIENLSTWAEWFEAFLPNTDNNKSIEDKLAEVLQLSKDDESLQKLLWIGLQEDENINTKETLTSAQILQKKLEQKWKIAPQDKDLVLMQHQFQYELQNKKYQITANLIVKGENATHTAMSKTVGLPLAIATKLVAENKIQEYGVMIPIHKQWYEPILAELKHFDIIFQEKHTELQK